jgi:hypothetical protein
VFDENPRDCNYKWYLKESRWALNSDELEVMTIKNTFISGKDKIN